MGKWIYLFLILDPDNFFFLCMPQINPHSTAKAVARDRGIGSNRGCEGVWKMVEDVQRREQRIPIANLHLWLVVVFFRKQILKGTGGKGLKS